MQLGSVVKLFVRIASQRRAKPKLTLDNEAFYHSQKPKPFDDEAWKVRREEVMMRGLRLKFAACADVCALLISTWPHPLLSVKCDNFWGFHPVAGFGFAFHKE
jgi:predicted NAD-dependent protein-ADP-ribosyltransferase YbiA (DUF1768 family)